MSVYKKLFEIQKRNIVMTADAENPFYHSKYVSIENIMSTLKPILEEFKLLLFHTVNGGTVVTFLVDTEMEDGQEHAQVISQFPINNQLDAQKIGATITYGKRYNIVAIFSLTEEDDDGNSALVIQPKQDAKKPYAAPTKTTGFGNKTTFEQAERWASKDEVDALLNDISEWKKLMPPDGDTLVREMRQKKIGVKKEFAEYIKEAIKAMQDKQSLPFKWDSPINIDDVPF